MKVIKKQLILSNEEYYLKHLAIINNFLPIKLTPKEIEVLANFMILEGDIASDRFGTTARKIVMSKMNIVTAGISNYIRSLKQKGFIIDNKVLPILFPESKNQMYNFKLSNND